jgi:DNA invertase Pin-like site-specific DNA recombinase
MEYVAYYRVSTTAQGQSGLGLEAQRVAVAQHLSATNSALIAEYTEVESASHHDLKKRPQLVAALAMAKKRKATLIIAKLDRLSRSVLATSQLMASNTPFLALDMPHANALTVHILAAVAQHEAAMIGQRISAALQVKKSRGERLGASPATLAKATAAAAEKRRKARVQVSTHGVN